MDDMLAAAQAAQDASVSSPAPMAPEIETAQQAAAALPLLSDFLRLVDQWWGENFPGSPVSRVTEAWNHAAAAREDLKRRLSDLLGS